MNQQPLFSTTTLIKHTTFDGPNYKPERDHARLTAQALRIFDLMKDGKWRTLREIAAETGDPETSVSAQLRHLRKARNGGHTIEKQYIDCGLYMYRMMANTNEV